MAQEQAWFLQTEYAEILDQGRYCAVTKVRSLVVRLERFRTRPKHSGKA